MSAPSRAAAPPAAPPASPPVPLPAAAAVASVQAKLAKANELKTRGNELFKAGEFRKAAKEYRYVFAYVNGLVSSSDAQMRAYAKQEDMLAEADVKAVDELKRAAYSNLAACYLKLGEFAKARAAAEGALKVDAKDVKSLMRLGLALSGLKEWDKAKKALLDADKLDPRNAAVLLALREWKAAFTAWLAEQNEKERQAFQGKLL
jgi:tetratricopeptide (TPR) repeat protein